MQSACGAYAFRLTCLATRALSHHTSMLAALGAGVGLFGISNSGSTHRLRGGRATAFTGTLKGKETPHQCPQLTTRFKLKVHLHVLFFAQVLCTGAAALLEACNKLGMRCYQQCTNCATSCAHCNSEANGHWKGMPSLVILR